jgi:hypothetical protein
VPWSPLGRTDHEKPYPRDRTFSHALPSSTASTRGERRVGVRGRLRCD